MAPVTDPIHDRLVAEQERLDSEMQSIRSSENVSVTERTSTGDLSGNDQHPAEEGTETFDRERDLSLLESLEHEMDEVQAALDRLEDGSYGKCEVCGRPIGDERLEAVPETRYCIEHERMREEPEPNLHGNHEEAEL
jgi:DnaK suppressor protein